LARVPPCLYDIIKAMNAKDILHFGDKDLRGAFKGLSKRAWQKVGVTTKWSLRDLLAHMISYEWLLVDAFRYVLKIKPTQTLDAMNAGYEKFNDAEVLARAGKSPQMLMREYSRAYKEVIKLAKKLSPEKLRKPGTIPWYGKQYSLDDFIVYANYAHKREHVAGINQFRKKMKKYGK